MRTPTVMIRIPDDLRERIDNARGDIPRERWVRRKLEEALERERKAKARAKT